MLHEYRTNKKYGRVMNRVPVFIFFTNCCVRKRDRANAFGLGFSSSSLFFLLTTGWGNARSLDWGVGVHAVTLLQQAWLPWDTKEMGVGGGGTRGEFVDEEDAPPLLCPIRSAVHAFSLCSLFSLI